MHCMRFSAWDLLLQVIGVIVGFRQDADPGEGEGLRRRMDSTA